MSKASPTPQRPDGDVADTIADTIAAPISGASSQRLLPESGPVAPLRVGRPDVSVEAPTIGDVRYSHLPSDPPASGDEAELPVVDPSSYAVSGELARGGIGRILRAKDGRLKRNVALKELLDAHGGNSERFIREALLTARLQHPAIVPVYEAGRWPTGEPFFAMKLVSGKSLEHVIDATRSFAERLALLHHAVAVTEAIAYAHSERIIHRDLKPQNILVGAFGETVVIDWGLAKDLAAEEASLAAGGASASASAGPHTSMSRALTAFGAVMGTPAYMPLEQAMGKPADERADVYALGAILYHMLSGVPPYDGDSSMEILMKVTDGPPTPLEKVERDIPDDLIAIVKKAMDRDQERRYRTAKELAEDLRRFEAGQIVGAHRYSTMELFRRFVGRYRAPLAVAAAALIVLLITGVIGISRINDARLRALAKQAEAEEAHRQSTERADDLTLVEARASLDRDPNKAIGWLRTLSADFSRWGSARFIAADAKARGIAKIFRGHTAVINFVAYSPDGKILASAGDDKQIRLWDAATGQSRVLEGHTDEVWRLAFSPDGKLLASGGKDKTVRVWDVKTGAGRVVCEHEGPILRVLFSREGDRLITAGQDPRILITDITKPAPAGTTVLEGHEGRVSALALSPDGKLLASGGSDKALHLSNLVTGEKRSLTGHTEPITHAAFSLDGRIVATASNDATIRLWDVATGESRPLTGHHGAFGSIAFSPDRKTLASAGSDGTVRLWPLYSFEPPRVLEGHKGSVWSIAFSHDGKTLASGSSDRTVRVWNVDRGESRTLVGFEDAILTVAMAPDDATFAAGSWDHTVRVFDVTAGAKAVFADHRGEVMRAELSPDGKRIASASADGTARIMSADGTGVPVVLEGHEGPLSAAVFSPDSALVATAGADGTARIWDLKGRSLWTIAGHKGRVSSIAFAPDGKLLLTADEGGSIRLVDVATGQARALAGHTQRINEALFSPNGASIATASDDKTVRVWDVKTGDSRALRGHDDVVWTVAFSPKGDTLASGSEDHTLRLWNLTSNAPSAARVMNASGYGIKQIIFSRDGERVISVGAETSVRVWSASTGEELRVLRGHREVVKRAALAPNGRTLATASRDGSLRLWDVTTGESFALLGHTGVVNDVRFASDGRSFVSAGDDKTVRVWPDDLPEGADELRAWLAAAAR